MLSSSKHPVAPLPLPAPLASPVPNDAYEWSCDGDHKGLEPLLTGQTHQLTKALSRHLTNLRGQTLHVGETSKQQAESTINSIKKVDCLSSAGRWQGDLSCHLPHSALNHPTNRTAQQDTPCHP